MAGLRLLTAVLRPDGERADKEVEHGAGHRGNGDHWHSLRAEIARARRFERSFALVRIEPVPDVFVAQFVRSVDYAWVADGSAYLLLPEGTHRDAEGLIVRLREAMADEVAGKRITYAAFPDDGLTTGGLLRKLHDTVDRRAAKEADRRHLTLEPSAIHANSR